MPPAHSLIHAIINTKILSAKYMAGAGRQVNKTGNCPYTS